MFDVGGASEVVLRSSIVHAVHAIDGPLALPKLRQVLDLYLLSLREGSHWRWRREREGGRGEGGWERGREGGREREIL